MKVFAVASRSTGLPTDQHSTAHVTND